MISFITRQIARTALPEQYHRAAAWALIVAVAIPLLIGLKSCYDSSVVENATNQANAEFTAEQIEVERELGEEKQHRDSANSQETANQLETIDEAENDGRTAADTVWERLWN